MFVHGSAIRTQALELIRSGLNDCEVSRRLRVPRSTIRDWRRPTYVRRTPSLPCPRCWRGVGSPFGFTDDDYAELLALYLG
jgi:hypothetical protein